MAEGPTERQGRASDPGASVWVTANAGSGKTKVLTDRVARLLLSGVTPQRILCLTYTRAGAAEMQVRLFARLGGWAMLPEAELRDALARLSPGPVADDDLARARRLFAQAIETPGGLRIQTIHSFCASLLRRFPLEAGVSPSFAEIEERAARLMVQEVLDDLAGQGALDGIAAQFTGGDLADLAEIVSAHRARFMPPLTGPQIRAALGVPEGETVARVLATVFDGTEGDLVTAILPALRAGKPTDAKLAEALAGLDLGQPDGVSLAALEGLFLFGATAKAPFGPKIGSLPTKDCRATLGPWLQPLDDLMQRVADARPRRVALEAARRAEALHAFAAAFLPAYAARKARRGALDFEDLILAAARLLGDPGLSPWVLWKLDGAIDHILVDEAQDTSPTQWRLIERLAADITAGRGTRPDSPRSLFVVGDRKQSIYSFQGADLRAFAATEKAFRERFAGVGAEIRRVEMPHSFRSSPVVLRLVDATFDAAAGRELDGAVQHIAFNDAMPGRVELWAPEPKAELPPPGEWFEALDRWSEEHHAARLARRIADRLTDLFAQGARVPVHDRPGESRPLTPGDVLILVRRRSDIFDEVIRALKGAGLPVAGADRLKLGGELAVRDLLALLSVVAMPDDDLSLAAVLRSPLVGLSEDGLFRWAHGRPGRLWQALPDDAPGMAMLRDLMAQADYLRPFELLDRALTRHDGRRRLLARLGPEAEDGIDALLAQALAYEREGVPGLTGFLVWMGAQDLQIKRRPDAGGGTIRVMTVHSAKGLEAPLVILPDTAKRRPHNPDEVVPLIDGPPVWRMPRPEAPEPLAEALADHGLREAGEQDRLLYVALTRAQSWLIVAAAGDLGKDGETDDAARVWYRMVRAGMEACGAETEGEGLLLIGGDWPAPQGIVADAPAPAVTLPDWATRPVPADAAPVPMLAPSGLGGAKALPGEPATPDAVAEAMARGTRLHLLLEHLPGVPPADRAAVATALLPGAGDIPALLAEAQAVLEDPALAHLFSPDALAEAPFAAPWRDGITLGGTIDRLIVAPDRVLAVDFKSNRVVPPTAAEVPEGILRQMGAYAYALALIFPGRRVEVAILWTATARLMPLPCAQVLAALQRALPQPDADPAFLTFDGATPSFDA